jgi:hypothetical protein
MNTRDANTKGSKATEFHVNEQELQALSERVAERKIEEKDWDILHRYLLLFLKLSQVFQYSRVKMRKVVRMLFGKRTEKERKKEKDPSDNPPQAGARGRDTDWPGKGLRT